MALFLSNFQKYYEFAESVQKSLSNVLLLVNHIINTGRSGKYFRDYIGIKPDLIPETIFPVKNTRNLNFWRKKSCIRDHQGIKSSAKIRINDAEKPDKPL